MATPSAGARNARKAVRFRELLSSWWEHRASFLISMSITLLALLMYFLTFLGERSTPLFSFLQRLESDSLDMRFRYRPEHYAPADPRIVIVDIDQRSQEVLGRWPFSRSHFARLLDVLHDNGAAVAAFDITFSKPDQSAAPIRALWAELQARARRGEAVDPKLAGEVRKLAASYDSDTQFAAAIHRFGPVILGDFFLFTDADLRGLSDATLDAYANQISFFAYPPAHPLRPEFQKQDKLRLMEEFSLSNLIPKGTEANLDTFTSALNGDASWTGFFNAPPDDDGVVRRATMILPYGRSANLQDWDLYPSLDLMAARAFLGEKALDSNLIYGPVGIVEIQFGKLLSLRPDSRGQRMINYLGPSGTFPHYSMAEVLSGNFPAGTFSGKIVLIGATATGIGDLKTTPFGGTNYPGVEIHANVIDNILNQRFLQHGVRQILTDILLIFAFGIPLGFVLAMVSTRWMWFGLGLLIPFTAMAYFAFLRGAWLNFILPAGTLTANVMLVSLYRALVEEKEKRKVRSAFGQYLSPEVIRRLLVNPQLVDPRKTDITVMFSDIRGFTTISEKLDAQELALFLNNYLSDMTRIVFDTQGTLDKYIGDAVMAFWGAPYEDGGHAVKACTAAIVMMKRVRELQKKWEAEGKPKLDIGIGVNSGVASVGNMGSALRYGYTALGDSVNLASRLEGLNKDYGTHILVNESTYAAAQSSGFLFRELDIIRVKGKLQPVTIYELLGRLSELQLEPDFADLERTIRQFAEARRLYHQRQWSEAQRAFQSILDGRPDDGPSRTYWKRCQEYLFDEPSPSWDGVFTMTHK